MQTTPLGKDNLKITQSKVMAFFYNVLFECRDVFRLECQLASSFVLTQACFTFSISTPNFTCCKLHVSFCSCQCFHQTAFAIRVRHSSIWPRRIYLAMLDRPHNIRPFVGKFSSQCVNPVLVSSGNQHHVFGGSAFKLKTKSHNALIDLELSGNRFTSRSLFKIFVF